MFKIHALQAAFGDSLILEFGTTASPRFVLIDGGPEDTYAASLRDELLQIGAAGGALDRVILSHVDGDHIIGLLDLFSELRQNTAPIAVAELWHNSFAQTIDDGPNNIQARAQTMLAGVMNANSVMAASSDEINTIAEGNKLRLDALALAMPINPGFPNDLVSNDTAAGPLPWGNLTVTIVGPTTVNLNNLKQEWLTWLQDNEGPLANGVPLVAAMADVSKPNLSSIQLHVKDDTGKTALFTGDGRGDHLLQGLGRPTCSRLPAHPRRRIQELPHRGSDQISRSVLQEGHGRHYIACATAKTAIPTTRR